MATRYSIRDVLGRFAKRANRAPLSENVSSSAIINVSWRPDGGEMMFGDVNLGTLTIEFARRGIYEYTGVSIDEYESLVNSGSKGSYFNRYIRNEGYYYKKVG